MMVKLVVFFMVVAVAKSLGNKCDVPPEFWCGSEKVARHCQVGLFFLFLPAKLLAKKVTKKCIFTHSYELEISVLIPLLTRIC